MQKINQLEQENKSLKEAMNSFKMNWKNEKKNENNQFKK